jgi:hypothetical protein
MTARPTTAELLSEFEETLLALDAACIELGGSAKPWNRLMNRAQAIQLALRETSEGRAGITALVASDVSTVRLHAACYALSWDEPIARAELERQMADPGLASVDAKWTLREFDRGRLDNTWIPKDR